MKFNVFFLLLFASFCLHAQLQTDLSLPYLVREPSLKSNRPPLIVLLHGYGSNEADLFALQAQLPAQFIVVAVRAPLALSTNSFQWFRMETVNGVMNGNAQDLKSSREKIVTMVKQLCAKYKADPSQVYLCGFSQGAMMSYEAGLSSPELFRGIAPLSGKIFPSLKPDVKPGEALSALRVFIGHGDADNRVAYQHATEAVLYLKGLGISPELHRYDGLAHAINAEELRELANWLEQK